MSIKCIKCGEKEARWMDDDLLCDTCCPHWTTETPTEPGWYKVLFDAGDKVVYGITKELPDFHGELMVVGDDEYGHPTHISSFKGRPLRWWSEPIEFEDVPE